MPILAGKEISLNGLGLMRLTWHSGPTPEEQSFAVLKAALKAGLNVWNGADFYGTPEYNSLHLMRNYFTAYPEDAEKVVLTIKSGVADARRFKMDCSAAGLRRSVEAALKVLDGKKGIDVFGCARVDPEVPVEESIGALAAMREEGLIGGIQMSEVRAETIRRAARVTRVDMVEAEVSLWSREVFENGVAEACGELGIVLVAHTPLGAGLLAGEIRSLDDVDANSHHRMFPRFQPENIEQNLKVVEELRRVALGKGCSVAQFALSWVKAQGRRPGMPAIVPIAGARTVDRVVENVRDVELSEGDLEEIASIMDSFPVAGKRFPEVAAGLNEY